MTREGKVGGNSPGENDRGGSSLFLLRQIFGGYEIPSYFKPVNMIKQLLKLRKPVVMGENILK